MRQLKLVRKVKNNYRYYLIEMTLNLFGEWILQIKYGAVKNKAPTGIIFKYFTTHVDAVQNFEYVLNKKVRRGYYLVDA